MKFSEEQIIIRLQSVKHSFSYSQGKLIAEFKFLNFTEAFSFATQVALEASQIQHYPTIQIGGNKVQLWLYSPVEVGITEKDFELAKRILNIQ